MSYEAEKVYRFFSPDFHVAPLTVSAMIAPSCSAILNNRDHFEQILRKLAIVQLVPTQFSEVNTEYY